MNQNNLNEKLLEEKLTQLEEIKTWSSRVVSKLETLIRTGSDIQLFRINILNFAEEKNISEKEVTELFLYSTKLGIFQMNWQLLCPACSCVVESFSSLASVGLKYHCDICVFEYEASLDDFIEVSFTISPLIREIKFHNLKQLSEEDIVDYYKFSPCSFFSPNGTSFIDAFKSGLRIISYLNPNEKKEIDTELQPGMYFLLDLIGKANSMIMINEGVSTEIQRNKVIFVNENFELQKTEQNSGKIVFEIENNSDKRFLCALFYLQPDRAQMKLEFKPFLSGKKIINTQTFRNLFHSETIQSAEGLGVKDLTVLFTDLKGSTELYDRIGDLKAFSLVQQHFERLGKVIENNSGATVKTIGDAIMATFLNPVDGLKGALSILEEIEKFNVEYGSRVLILKIGLHKGALIAVTLNNRLDYFGQSVNIASRVQGLAGADEIYISQDIYSYPGVKELLNDLKVGVEPVKAKLKGIQEEMTVFKITIKIKEKIS